MRKALIGITPLVLTLAGFGQATSRPATTAKSPASSSTAQTAAAAQPAAPEHPLTESQAHELMELTGTDKLKEQLVANANTYFHRAFPPYMPADVLEDITSSLQKADMTTPVVGIYRRYLSTEDAAKAIEFYKTPAGRDLIKATPQILGEAQHSAGETAQKIVKDVMDRHKVEIDAAQKKYQDEHQPPTLGAKSPGGNGPNGAAARPAGPAGTSTAPATAPQR